MQKILDTLELLESNDQPWSSNHRESLWKFYTQLNLQPIEFSTWGLYTINYRLLAAVRKNEDSLPFL